jgi:hypothetical protein
MLTRNFPTWLKVDALYGDREIGIPHLCCIGSISKKRNDLNIRIKIAKKTKKNAAIFYFDARNKKPIYLPEKSSNKKWATYIKNVPIQAPDDEVCDTIPGQNYLLVSMIRPEKNIIEIWQVSIVAQYGMFFLRTQKITSQIIYKNNLGHLVIRDLSHWKAMESFIEGLHHFRKMKISEKIPIISSISSHTVLADNEGIILWWNESSGSGIALTNFGLGYIDWYQVSDKNFVTFSQGEHVSFGFKDKTPADWMFGPCPLKLGKVAKKGGVRSEPIKPYYPGQTTTRNKNASS